MTHHQTGERVEVVFRGNVQGVGFRFTVMQLAENFSVTGIVRNEWDGSVSLVAEGEHSELCRFLSAVQSSRLSRYIHDSQVQWSSASGQYESFRISM